MGGGPPCFQRDFSCPAVLRIISHFHFRFRLRDYYPLRLPFPGAIPLPSVPAFVEISYYPLRIATQGLGCSLFARRYLGNRFCFLFLGVLRCFSSPGLPLPALFYSGRSTRSSIWWVAPFGYLRIFAHLQLPAAFRCSSRPSSAPGAKASSVCSIYLFHIVFA